MLKIIPKFRILWTILAYGNTPKTIKIKRIELIILQVPNIIYMITIKTERYNTL